MIWILCIAFMLFILKKLLNNSEKINPGFKQRNKKEVLFFYLMYSLAGVLFAWTILMLWSFNTTSFTVSPEKISSTKIETISDNKEFYIFNTIDDNSSQYFYYSYNNKVMRKIMNDKTIIKNDTVQYPIIDKYNCTTESNKLIKILFFTNLYNLYDLDTIRIPNNYKIINCDEYLKNK